MTADYLEAHADTLVKGKTVLEFGAGAGLPSLVCGIRGARRVVVSDYPDGELVQNLRGNIERCMKGEDLGDGDGIGMGNGVVVVVAEGYVWGDDPKGLLRHLLPVPGSADVEIDGRGGEAEAGSRFDLLILADLLFNHSEHRKLVLSMQKTLKRTPEAKVLVFFTPHRPWLLERDMAFFDIAREMGFRVEQVLEKKMQEAMKVEGDGKVSRSVHDEGDEAIRKVVFGYELTWKSC